MLPFVLEDRMDEGTAICYMEDIRHDIVDELQAIVLRLSCNIKPDERSALEHRRKDLSLRVAAIDIAIDALKFT